MRHPSHTHPAKLVVLLVGLVASIAGIVLGTAASPLCATAHAADRAMSRRLIAAISSGSDEVLELWERTFPDGMLTRSSGRTGIGPGGDGPPAKAFYLVRRTADGSRRRLLGVGYVMDWVSGHLPPAAGATYSAAFAADPRSGSLSVVVMRSIAGSCELEQFAVSAESASAAFQGDDPFPTDDPAGTWPAGPVLHKGRAPETRCVLLPDPVPIIATTLVSDETGLLLYVRAAVPSKCPLYMRRKLGGDCWELATITGR